MKVDTSPVFDEMNRSTLGDKVFQAAASKLCREEQDKKH